MKEMEEMQAIKEFTEWCNTPVGRYGLLSMSTRVVVQFPSCNRYRILDENGDNLFSQFKFLTFEELYDYYVNIRDRGLIIIDCIGQTLKTEKYSHRKCYKMLEKFKQLNIECNCVEDSMGLKVFQITEGKLPTDFKFD